MRAPHPSNEPTQASVKTKTPPTAKLLLELRERVKRLEAVVQSLCLELGHPYE